MVDIWPIVIVGFPIKPNWGFSTLLCNLTTLLDQHCRQPELHFLTPLEDSGRLPGTIFFEVFSRRIKTWDITNGDPSFCSFQNASRHVDNLYVSDLESFLRWFKGATGPPRKVQLGNHEVGASDCLSRKEPATGVLNLKMS